MSTAMIVTNPFAGEAPKRELATTTKAEESRSIAEVQAAMAIAKRFPRDKVSAMDRILSACTRESLANHALYTYAKGGQDISGPSIRLAEVLVQEWGNIEYGVRELDTRDGSSLVEAYAWDLETNTRSRKQFNVSHKVDTKRGPKTLTDQREIYEHVANMGSRRLRACILAVIPGDVTEAAVAQCEATLNEKTDVTPEAIKKLLATFEGIGVTQEQIEKRIQRRIEAIRPSQMVQMRKIFLSIRDGMSKADAWFDAVATDAMPAGGNERLAAMLETREPGEEG